MTAETSMRQLSSVHIIPRRRSTIDAMAQRDVRAMSEDELFEDWGRQIERTAQELSGVYNDRDIFRHIRLMFDTNPHTTRSEDPDSYTESAGYLLSWLARLYGNDVLMFVRREFDTQPGTVNLRQLFSEMKLRPQVLTRTRYRATYAKLVGRCHDPLAEAFFSRLKRITIGDDDHLDPAEIEADRERLHSEVEAILEYANRNLAHRTPEWVPPDIRVPDGLDQPLQAICDTFNKYYAVLTGKSMPDPTPSASFYWEECLTKPLATDAYYEAKRLGVTKAQQEISRAVMERMTKRKITPN